MKKCLTLFLFLCVAEKKRKIYDQYGKEGLIGHSENNYGGHRRRHDPFENDFIFGGFPFVFRDPEEVFREFFGGGSPFDDFFNPGQSRRHHHHHHQNGAGSSRHHRSSHPQNVMSPFLSFSLMDDMFSHSFNGGLNSMGNGFTSLSTFSNGAHASGNVKRISTSTSFVNGKKVTTKK
jgi:DnaJ family protein B protein 6